MAMVTKKNDSVSYKIKNVILNICKYALLIFAAFIALVPIVSCVVTAFKTVDEYNNTNVMTPPKSWLNFDNFITAWQKADMGHAFLNSFLVLVCVLAGSIMISSMLAYVLNRFKFPGNGLIRNLFMIATLIPGIATQVTVYQIMTALHLVNSLPGYMLLMMGTDVITIYIFLQFFENLSVSLDESAILDGCSYFGVFFKILLPLLKPAVVTSAILKGVSTYNEYYMANLYLQDKNKYQVVSTSLYVFSGPMGSQYNYICAGVIITIIPALIIFLLCQDQIYSGMAAGAKKNNRGVTQYVYCKTVLRRTAEYALAGKACLLQRPCLALYRKPRYRAQPAARRGAHLQLCRGALSGRVHRCFPRRAGQRHPVYLSGTQRRRHPLGF